MVLEKSETLQQWRGGSLATPRPTMLPTIRIVHDSLAMFNVPKSKPKITLSAVVLGESTFVNVIPY